MTHAIWWIRRDLRLSDNAALNAAMRSGSVVPLFVLDPALTGRRAALTRRWQFLTRGLTELASEIEARGSRLIVRSGPPAREVARLVNALGGAPVFAEEDFTPYARRRDEAVARTVNLQLLPGLAIRHPARMLNRQDRPFVTFRGFRQAWRASPELPTLHDAPARLQATPSVSSEPVPSWRSRQSGQEASESAAHAALDRFVAEGIENYAARRDRLDMDGTSKLSPYVRFGMIAPSRLLAAASKASSDSSRAWIDELAWRDFYIATLYHLPATAAGNFAPFGDKIRWRNDQGEFERWRSGTTGYPVVDAAMRQLAATGWIHNRSRMIVASFLVKHLLIDWRWGERWFRDQLVDGDLAANVGGWQWVAGTGPDASPYFRIFNPALQGARFDPDGDFVRAWVPELHGVRGGDVHDRLPELSDYPAPVVEHRFARARALEVYRSAIKETREAK